MANPKPKPKPDPKPYKHLEDVDMDGFCERLVEDICLEFQLPREYVVGNRHAP